MIRAWVMSQDVVDAPDPWFGAFLVRDDPALATGPSPFRRLSARQTFTHMLVMPVIIGTFRGVVVATCRRCWRPRGGARTPWRRFHGLTRDLHAVGRSAC